MRHLSPEKSITHSAESLNQNIFSDQTPLHAFPLSICIREIVTALRKNDRKTILLQSRRAAEFRFAQSSSCSSNYKIASNGSFFNEEMFQSFSKMRMNLIFGDVFHFFSNESIARCEEMLLILNSIFKDDDNLDSTHMVLSDLYMDLSVLRQKQERCQEALEFGGRSLYIRVKLSSLLIEQLNTNGTFSGVLKKNIDIKVSDSHYHLAHVYRQLSDYVNSKRELFLCRSLRCKIHGEDSLAVSHCDLMLGQVYASAGNRAEAYVAFYRSYRSRLNHLGADHQQTVAAKTALLQQRHQSFQEGVPTGSSFDKSIVCGFELKAMALALKLHDYPPNSFEYCMYLLIYRIENEDVFSFQQFHFMISSAAKFAERDANPMQQMDDLLAQNLPLVDSLADKFIKIAYSTGSDFATDNEAVESVIVSASFVEPIDLGATIAVEESKYTDTSNSPYIEDEHINGRPSQLLSSSPPNIDLLIEERREVVPEHQVVSIFHEKATISSPKSSNSTIEPLQLPTRTLGFSLVRDESSEDEREGLVSWDGKFIHVYQPMRSPNRSIVIPNYSSQQSDTTSNAPIDYENTRAVALTIPFAMPSKSAVGGGHLIARDSVGTLVLIKRLDLGEFLAFAIVKLYPKVLEGEVQDRSATYNNKSSFSKTRPSILIDSSINKVEPSRRVSFISRAVTANQPHQVPSGARRSSSTYLDNFHSPLGSSALYSADAIPFEQSRSSDSNNAEPKSKRKSVSFGVNSMTNASTPAATAPSTSLNYTTVDGIRRAIDVPIPPPVPSSWPPTPFTEDSNSTASNSALVAPIGKTHPTPSPSALAMKSSLSAVNKLFDQIAVDDGGAAKPKLKQLHLVQLQGPVEGTIWAPNKEDVNLPSDFFSNIMEEFEISTKKKTAASSKKSGEKGSLNRDGNKGQPTAAQPIIIDPQRSQHINIMLAKFSKRTLQSIAEAVRDLNIDELGQSLISSLLQFIPTKDETAKINKFLQSAKSTSSSNESMLGKAEEFIWTMSKVEAFELRLTVMSFFLSYKEVAKDISSKTDILFKAIQEVRGSARFKFLLRAFLCLDNTLGRRDENNKTVGFKLEALEKLRQIKSNSGESIEQYVAHQLIRSEFVDALDILSDFPSLDQAMSVRFGRLAIDIKKLEEGVRQLRQFISSEQSAVTAIADSKSDTADDPEPDLNPDLSQSSSTIAVQRATSFLLEVQKEATECATLINDTAEDFHTLLRYLGFVDNNKEETDHRRDDAKDRAAGRDTSLSPELVFGQVLSFAKSIHSASSYAQVKEKRRLKMLSS